MTDVKSAPATVSFRPDPEGDRALSASFRRLLAADYAVDAVIDKSISSDWPGDVAGRLLLSLTRLWRSGYDTEERARSLFTGMIRPMNPGGCFGPELRDRVDEQQLACQGWVVSGLLQCSIAFGRSARRRTGSPRPAMHPATGARSHRPDHLHLRKRSSCAFLPRAGA